jgi:SAM-dependent methyltransferase
MSTNSFDSAAASYDAARGFPPGVGEQVAEAAADWIHKRAPVLEVGIGTGRIAKPLLALGLNVTGVDLSRQMMARLRETLPTGQPSPALVQGDAAHLPLSKQSVGAVVSVHVFQLLSDWSNAVSEVRRVLCPGGVFLNGYEWRPPDSPGARIMERWRMILEAAGQPALAAGAREFSDLRAELLQTGAAYEERAVGHWTTTRSPARQLETIEHRTWSSSAGVSDNLLAGCLAELKSWAIEEFGELDQGRAVSHHFVWQRFTWF